MTPTEEPTDPAEPEVVSGHGPWRITTYGRRFMVEVWTLSTDGDALDYRVIKAEEPANGTEHPRWASPPFPDRPPTRLSQALIRATEWLRRRGEGS